MLSDNFDKMMAQRYALKQQAQQHKEGMVNGESVGEGGQATKKARVEAEAGAGAEA